MAVVATRGKVPASADLQSLARRQHLGQRGHWVLPVVATAMVWAAVTGNVGLGACGLQRHRTGAFDRVQTSGCSLRTGHTEHRYSGS